jgi:two-component system chemotaxis response regulator CheY
VRILVVDDDVVTLRLVSHCLRNLGHEVTVAPDGQAGRRLFRLHRFSVVITDWEMPGLSGPELCREIRNLKLPGYTYIIILTQRHERRYLIQGLEAGADDFASKPFDQAEMRVRLRAAERILTLESQLLEANRKLTLMNNRLQKSSRLDPLTEIGNRLAFEEEVSAFHRHAVSRGAQYGLIMCDVDNFKQFNDRFGHQTGDEVLRHIAAEIRKSIRALDSAFRYGGEEIVVLLSGQNLERSVISAERIRQQIAKLQLRPGPDGSACRTTISCGVASYPENFDPASDWRGLVACADRALYRAKDGGRNRVEAFSAEPVPAPRLLTSDVPA